MAQIEAECSEYADVSGDIVERCSAEEEGLTMEMSGKTIEEAIQHALAELGVRREEVKVTILKEGKQGIFGLGGEEAVVRVEPLASVSVEGDATVEAAKDILEELLSLIGVDGSVAPQAGLFGEGEEEEAAPVAFNITGEDLGILIGRRGQTLACLQYIFRLIVGHRTKVWMPIVIDVEGYKQRRYRALRALAGRIAEQVKARRMPFTLEPMPPYERRIIHLALANHPDVTTQSIGEDDSRKVVVLLKVE